MSHDVRAIANLVLEWADANDREISNFAINKVVFFLHAHVLVAFDKPLVTAKIEAWTYGPVFRELFREFRIFGRDAIRVRAKRTDPLTGVQEVCVANLDPSLAEFLNSLIPKYASLSASALFSLSHETGGPWDKVWNHDRDINTSMKISDELIREWFLTTARH